MFTGIVQGIAHLERITDRPGLRTLRIAFLSSAALDLLETISVAMVAVAVGLRMAHGDVSLLTGLMAILIAPEDDREIQLGKQQLIDPMPADWDRHGLRAGLTTAETILSASELL